MKELLLVGGAGAASRFMGLQGKTEHEILIIFSSCKV